MEFADKVCEDRETGGEKEVVAIISCKTIPKIEVWKFLVYRQDFVAHVLFFPGRSATAPTTLHLRRLCELRVIVYRIGTPMTGRNWRKTRVNDYVRTDDLLTFGVSDDTHASLYNEEKEMEL